MLRSEPSTKRHLKPREGSYADMVIGPGGVPPLGSREGSRPPVRLDSREDFLMKQ